MLMIHPHLVTIASGLQRVDALVPTFREQAMHIRHGIVFILLTVQLGRYIGKKPLSGFPPQISRLTPYARKNAQSEAHSFVFPLR